MKKARNSRQLSAWTGFTRWTPKGRTRIAPPGLFPWEGFFLGYRAVEGEPQLYGILRDNRSQSKCHFADTISSQKVTFCEIRGGAGWSRPHRTRDPIFLTLPPWNRPSEEFRKSEVNLPKSRNIGKQMANLYTLFHGMMYGLYKRLLHGLLGKPPPAKG